MTAATLRLTAALGAMLMLGAAAAGATDFVLQDGSVIQGRLIASTRNTLTIRPDVGGIRQVPRGRLAGIRVATPSGRIVAGLLREAEGARMAIEVEGERLVWVEDDRLVADGPPPPDPIEAPAPPARVPQEPAGSADTAVAVAGPPLIEVTPKDGSASERDGSVAFDVRLSHAPEGEVRLIYSTVDGQAKAGEDFEQSRGVITLDAGEMSRRIEASLVDDGEREEAERFFLFLSVDPAEASLVEKWYSITIEDDD